jgi:hypothetical protein
VKKGILFSQKIVKPEEGSFRAGVSGEGPRGPVGSDFDGFTEPFYHVHKNSMVYRHICCILLVKES